MVAIIKPRYTQQTLTNGVANGKILKEKEKLPSSPSSQQNNLTDKLSTLFRKYFSTYIGLLKRKYNEYRRRRRQVSEEYEEEEHLLPAAMSLLGFCFVMIVGYISMNLYPHKTATDKKNRKGYVPLTGLTEHMYVHYYFRRVIDAFFRPVQSSSGLKIDIGDRVTDDYNWSFRETGTKTTCVNMGAFNYLGFSETEGPNVKDCENVIRKHGVSTCSSFTDYGVSPIQLELEDGMAKFLKVEDAAVFGMGFGTNSLNLPSMISEESLILSDERNHASLILGIRIAKVSYVVFKHNSYKDLEKKLRAGILNGQPGTGKPWKKIYVVVEGVYSMDGTILCLPEIMVLKEKYKFYLYIDEAHSIGAIGATGRGVTEYHRVDPRKVELLMGSFSKSFGAIGGYIAGSKKIIDHLRRNSHDTHYAVSISPPIAQFLSCVLKVVTNPHHPSSGLKRIRQLEINVHYFRQRLSQLGVVVYGHQDSPVVPIIIYSGSKLLALSRLFLKRNFNIVIVGYPITPFTTARMRFCLSAHHTKEHLDKIIGIIDEVADDYGLRHSRKPPYKGPITYEDLKIEFPN